MATAKLRTITEVAGYHAALGRHTEMTKVYTEMLRQRCGFVSVFIGEIFIELAGWVLALFHLAIMRDG